MDIDIPTILLLTAFVCGTVGVIFLTAWWGSRGNDLELLIAATMFCCAAGALLIVLRGRVPDRISIDFANALIALGLGLAWSLARSFQGLRAPPAIIAAGAALWLLACLIPAIYDSFAWRVALISAITATYAAAAGFEFMRPRPESVRARRLVTVLLFGHAAFTYARGGFWLFGLAGPEPFTADWPQALILVEPLVAATTFGVLGMALIRGRTEHVLRLTAETDALTGVLNRHALMERGAMALEDGQRARQPVTVLIFDLDHFKAINDRFGHPVGDQTLCAFARVATRTIRANDLFGRIGGEEFAAVLVGAGVEIGERIAERIRLDFANAAPIGDGTVSTTVSVGVAEASPGPAVPSFGELLAQADEALYAAKRAGRDRVVRAFALAS